MLGGSVQVKAAHIGRGDGDKTLGVFFALVGSDRCNGVGLLVHVRGGLHVETEGRLLIFFVERKWSRGGRTAPARRQVQPHRALRSTFDVAAHHNRNVVVSLANWEHAMRHGKANADSRYYRQRWTHRAGLWVATDDPQRCSNRKLHACHREPRHAPNRRGWEGIGEMRFWVNGVNGFCDRFTVPVRACGLGVGGHLYVESHCHFPVVLQRCI